MNKLSGSQPVAILLCQLSDHASVEPRTTDWFRNFFARRGTGGVNDFWHDASRGAIDLDGSHVYGWRDVGIKLNDFIKKYTYWTVDPVTGEKREHRDRWGMTQFAIDAFSEVKFADYKSVIVFYNADVKNGGFIGSIGAGRILANVASLPGGVTWFSHEMGHALGFLDSFDESPRETWDVKGVYCDRHDIMSAMNVWNQQTPDFGLGGPLLNTAAMDLAGWLDSKRVLEWEQYYSQNPVTLKSLSRHPENGLLVLKCGPYYIELRTADGWDAGIPRATVLVHEITSWGGSGMRTVVKAPTPGANDACWNHEILPGKSITVSRSHTDFKEGNIYVNEWTLTVNSINVHKGEAQIFVAYKVERLPGPIFQYLPLDLEMVIVNPDWAIIGLGDGEIFSVPVNSKGYSLAKQTVRAIGVAYSSKNSPVSSQREKLASKLLNDAEVALKKVKRIITVRR